MKKIILATTLLCINMMHSQIVKKDITTKRVTISPKIDGKLDDEAWQDAEIAKDFVMLVPEAGTPEEHNKRTEVRIVYDDEAIYFGAYLYDDNPENIPTQFTDRDKFGVCDWFSVMLNPNNDSRNDSEFFVLSTGTQVDAKSNTTRSDYTWNAVWDSAVEIVEDGWIVEMKIPYSVLRFSNKEIQTWGLNIHRHFTKASIRYTWNFIDRTIGNRQEYAGNIVGIRNISPPTRLSFSPYASAAYNTYEGNDYFEKSIGMDLKYGISEGFTLDATLIPDFGQTAYDKVVLNLGPFEQKFTEQRAFFTEGTEIFNKGNLVYTRRIGGKPTNYLGDGDLNENEEFIENPDKVNLLNAIKVSGRTEKGLGVGFFNAVTEETSAKIKDTITDETRTVVTEPLANYNILVLDQQFRKNSFVSLTNTNVLREGDVKDANVTALMYKVENKSNTHNVNGGVKTSRIREDGETEDGYSMSLGAGKSAGKWQYSALYQMADDTFDINDFGFQNVNNYQRYYLFGSYRIFEPTNTFRSFYLSYYSTIRYRFNDNAYTGNSTVFSLYATSLNRFSYGANYVSSFGDQFDYYEPQVEDRYFIRAPRARVATWFSTNHSKKLALSMYFFYASRKEVDKIDYGLNFGPRHRFSDKFSTSYLLQFRKGFNSRGRVEELDDDTIIFGVRDKKSITNTLSGQYNFNIKSSVSLSFRHYWSPIMYDDEYFQLEEDGTLSPNPYTGENDINYNTWNFDLNYVWQFAPGSQLVALYRSNILNSDEQSDLSFKDNLDNLFEQPKQQNLSLKLIYYIDYNNAKNWFKKT